MSEISELQAAIRRRFEPPTCPWCAQPIHRGQDIATVGGRTWHIGCRDDQQFGILEEWSGFWRKP